MSKTKEELDALKEEVNNVNEKLQELTPEELEQVNGGAKGGCGMAIFQDFGENILAGHPASASIFRAR